MDILKLKEQGINVEAALEYLGDVSMYEEMLNDFLDEMEERVSNLKKYYYDEDLDNYAILVHALKGDSKYLGFDKLAEMALEHQLKSQAGDLDYVKKNYSQLMEEVERIMLVVKEAVEG